jgi:hypothetical protein
VERKEELVVKGIILIGSLVIEAIFLVSDSLDITFVAAADWG